MMLCGGLSYPERSQERVGGTFELVESERMDKRLQSYERWTPCEGLPESPLVEVSCSFDAGELTATVRYPHNVTPNILFIRFGYVEAFKLYEEFSDPWMATGERLPRIKGSELNRSHWPLQRVRQSEWLARILARNGGLDGYDWRHYIVLTADRTLHVMTSEEPKNTAFE